MSWDLIFDCIPPIWSCCSLPRCKSLVCLFLYSVSYIFEGLPAESISQLISQFPYFYNDSRAEFLNILSSFKNLMWHFKPLLIGFLFPFTSNLGFPGGSVLRNLPAMHEMWAWSLGQAYPLEKEMSTHSSFLAWKIPRTEELGRLQSTELPKSRTQLSEQQAQFTFEIYKAYLSRFSTFIKYLLFSLVFERFIPFALG